MFIWQLYKLTHKNLQGDEFVKIKELLIRNTFVIKLVENKIRILEKSK